MKEPREEITELLGRRVFDCLEDSKHLALRATQAEALLAGEKLPVSVDRKIARRYEDANAALFEIIRRADGQ